mmetsp:Transcript_22762/g.38134  ORF Transcript_22762/g.38134 Transcript_22762/m.38134 type:complete len:614 (-) Transcript_22762:617-2458(-)
MMQLLLARGCFVAASIVITNNAALLALAYVVTSAYMVYITAKWLPYYNPLMNTIMCSMFCTVCWCSMCAFAISYTSSQQSDFVSLALCGGLLLAPLIAWCFTSSRQRQLRHKKWAVEVLGQFVTDRKFARPLDVEICARCVRLMLSEEKEEVREEWILRGSAIYKAGTDQFPKSGHVMLCYSNFCRHVLEDAQLELAFVERARHLELAFEERYEIYRKEKQREQERRLETSGEGVMDLASYVEFQKNYKAAKQAHLITLKAIKLFWKALLNTEQAMNKLPEASRLIDLYETKAEKTYRALIDKYPKSVRVLRSFANFCETVKFDLDAAENYFRRADRAESAQSKAFLNEDDADAESAAAGGKLTVSDDKDGVITINTVGVIQSVNIHICKMFGYKRAELLHKKVNLLMPLPYKEHHNTYLANYAKTGVAKMLGMNRKVEGQHRDGSTFPIRLTVSRIEVGNTVCYGGVVHRVAEDECLGVVNINERGIVLSVNTALKKMFGYELAELINHNVSKLMDPVPAANHDFYIQRFIDGKGGMIVGKGPRNTCGRHKDGTSFSISLEVNKVEEGNHTIFVGKILPTDELEVSWIQSMQTRLIEPLMQRRIIHICWRAL